MVLRARAGCKKSGVQVHSIVKVVKDQTTARDLLMALQARMKIARLALSLNIDLGRVPLEPALS